MNYNFRWVFITRFMMQQGVSTVTAFLEYWIDDMVHIPNCWSSEAGLTFILLPMLLTSALFSSDGIMCYSFGFCPRATSLLLWFSFIASVR
ncbi:hypothetical protein MXB_1948 [Myxobolus squamalis]|nr:hypothetical protein MXB_1948 [Myxobolus squamalis]